MKKNITIIFIIVLILVSSSIYLYISFREENKANTNITENVNKKDDIKVEVNENSENNNAIKPDISYGEEVKNDEKTDTTKENPVIPNENTVSENCIKVGGTLKKEKTGKGTEFGVCYFNDGKACEEWALANEDCPVGGVDTSMYNSKAEKLCLWLGARVDKEKSSCISEYWECGIDDLYNERCLPNY